MTSVKVTTIFGVDRLFDLLDVENAEKDSLIIIVKTGTADMGKQPIPIEENSRQ